MLAFELVATFKLLEDIWGAVDTLAIEPVAGFDSLDEPLEAVMTGSLGLVAGSDSPDDTLEVVMAETMELVADGMMGAVDMLTLELTGHLDELEDIPGILGI